MKISHNEKCGSMFFCERIREVDFLDHIVIMKLYIPDLYACILASPPSPHKEKCGRLFIYIIYIICEEKSTLGPACAG